MILYKFGFQKLISLENLYSMEFTALVVEIFSKASVGFLEIFRNKISIWNSDQKILRNTFRILFKIFHDVRKSTFGLTLRNFPTFPFAALVLKIFSKSFVEFWKFSSPKYAGRLATQNSSANIFRIFSKSSRMYQNQSLI